MKAKVWKILGSTLILIFALSIVPAARSIGAVQPRQNQTARYLLEQSLPEALLRYLP
ncbi:MAG: hypothetical protein ABSE15_05960 [Candidatus Bathyarchaeia archaeon]